MLSSARMLCAGVLVVASFSVASEAHAVALISNGGFETGNLSGWINQDQVGGSGSWFIQSGTGSPLNGFSVQVPPGGTFAAMTDQSGPGSHVLYQDFVVPIGVTAASISFEAFVSNQAGTYFSPDSLDALGGFENQQARVDILLASSDPFSVLAADVLANLFQTNPGDPSSFGYDPLSLDLTSLLQAHAGQTLRLRFAEADNQLFFNFGIDDVNLNAETTAVPEPSTFALFGAGLIVLSALRRRRKMKA